MNCAETCQDRPLSHGTCADEKGQVNASDAELPVVLVLASRLAWREVEELSAPEEQAVKCRSLNTSSLFQVVISAHVEATR